MPRRSRRAGFQALSGRGKINEEIALLFTASVAEASRAVAALPPSMAGVRGGRRGRSPGRRRSWHVWDSGHLEDSAWHCTPSSEQVERQAGRQGPGTRPGVAASSLG